jgi:predicted small lipoprotein YifL
MVMSRYSWLMLAIIAAMVFMLAGCGTSGG